MEHQFRRGIYRPNAQRLCISLEPMVVQRSLMFRVKSDLGTKTSYAELSHTDESPALYTLSGCAVLTAISVKSSAMTSASMYSQDSWKSASPSVSVSVVDVNPAITTSPADTVQLSHMEEKDSAKGFTSTSPSVPFVLTPPRDVSFSMVKDDNDTESHSKSDDVLSSANKLNNALRNSVRSLVDVGSLRSLGKRLSKIKPQNKKIDQHNPKLSRSSKSIRKVMNRLTFLPST
jgi:hypothetical protein